MAQSDSPFVIKKWVQDYDNGVLHYLAHVNNGSTWVIQDATDFDPETCIWYSGPTFNVSGSHHNYYFYDETEDKYHFLSAPLSGNQVPTLSADLPTSAQLKNPDEVYYFYDWDWDDYGGGVARGHDDNGWWEVHWISYSRYFQQWQTTPDKYNITDSCARFREVTVTEHEKAVNWTENHVGNLSDFAMEFTSGTAASHGLSISIGNYSYTCTPAYTSYVFEGTTHNFCNGQSLGTGTPAASSPVTGSTAASYHWEISGDAKDYLSFSSTMGSNVLTSTATAPTIYYTTENVQGNKTATITLTLTFSSGDTQATLVREATVTVKSRCQNPQQAAAPEVRYNDVTVRWYDVAEKYKLEWKPTTVTNWTNASSKENITNNYYTITDLTPGVTYHYRVIAYCGDAYLEPSAPLATFVPQDAPNLVVFGAIFGGGRMANVTGNPEIEIVNCDSIAAIYGGNDIAGEVQGTGGSTIKLGTTGTSAEVRIGSVYGGGNGYYAYDGTSFSGATATTTTVAANASVNAMTLDNHVGEAVWTNGDTPTTLTIPSIVKTNITVANDYVKVDSIFGGAKNAFLTLNDANDNGSTVNINAGTVFAIFGGNNFGGSQGNAKQYISVTNTKTNLDPTTGIKNLGRTHGIAYLFGGGNKVAGSTTSVNITGGQLDTIFGGGNQASVNQAVLEVNCPAGTNGTMISQAYDNNTGTINANYGWDGIGLYNVHTLFGGNNRADMDGVPYVTLTSGGVGTAYGGGNAGDMKAHVEQSLDGTLVNYGTHLELEQNTMVVDFLYGGCQMSNVDYSTWVQIKGGHVGTVYGGCNVSGDVGSTRTNPDAPAFIGPEGSQTANPEYQKVQGATWVKITGGTVYRNVFAGSNGYYHCNNGVNYIAGLDFGDPDDGTPAAYDPDQLYIGLPVPTHNETNLKISGGHIKGNVYAGGNLACVGFTDYTVPHEHTIQTNGLYPTFVGMSSVTMDAGEVDGNVFGGGNMASVFGSNSVQVSGGTIHGALYGGNDRTGQVAQITNRVLPDTYGFASDGKTNLTQLNVKSYVSLTGNPTIGTVYGGGNGDYIYDLTNPNHIQYCGLTPDEPIQSNTFVDININNNAKIGNVYGGGNGVTVIGGITVFLNVSDPDFDKVNVDTIFGGNNKGSLTLIPDIVLRKGKVNTIYGGCNQGAMYGWKTITVNGVDYPEVGSLVQLRKVYETYDTSVKPNVLTSTFTPEISISGAVYGGCKMNGATYNSMVLVEDERNSFVNTGIYGGSDISGEISGTSMVVLAQPKVNVGSVHGGGNGNYYYDAATGNVYQANDHSVLVAQAPDATHPIEPPYSINTQVDLRNGTANNIYGGGYACDAGYSTVNLYNGKVNNGAYGGCNAKGTIRNNVAVNVYGNANTTKMTDGIFGGGFGSATTTNGNVTVTIDKVEASAPAPTVFADIYGGSALGQVNASTTNLTKVDFKEGTLNGTLYGGGKGQGGTDPIAAVVNGDIQVAVSNGTINNNVFGGCNINGNVKGDIVVNMTGGTVGTSSAPTSVFGGGEGNLTSTEGNVEVNVNGASATVWGDVYGGSGYGNVNTYNNNKTTVVNILDGTVKRDVYGGGLGSTSPNYAALVNGKVYVNIGSVTPSSTPGGNPTYSGNAIINGSVYGCNNLNGSPQDSVFVNIYKTNHTPANAYPTSFPTSATQSEILTWLNGLPNTPANFALQAVYGGGNQAAYTPQYFNNKPRCTTVHVYDCQSNTIETLYGGGNAADVGYIVNGTTDTVHANTQMIVDGGRINRVFGGGNGYSSTGNHDDPTAANYNPGAFIFGTAYSHIHAGIINEVFGGANQYGGIDDIVLNLSGVGACTDQVYGSVFGCANEAPLNHSITTTIDCGVGTIGELYGGSNLAPIGIQGENNATVTLNLYGGTYSKVFGGSKGLAPNTTYPAGIPANIYGNVILNLYGGTIIDAFGGNDVNGSIGGTVTVNVLDYEDQYCPLNVTNIYGANNLAVYEPDDLTTGEKPISPVVNVMHLKTSVGNNVYGGAYGSDADVTSNPQVNIGYDDSMANWIPNDHKYKNDTDKLQAIVTNKVYGGGEMAKVVGTATVNIQKDNSQAKTLFGGGHQAGTTNTQVNILDGTVTTAVYGGCDEDGTITGNTEVNVLNDLGAGAPNAYNVNVFGGGLGEDTDTEGNVTVNIGGSNTSPVVYGTVYGGSAMGTVNDEATNDLTKVHLQSGTVNGNVFGGGLGDGSTPAYVKGNIQVIADGTNVNGNIFGANDQNGNPAGTVTVTVNSGTISQSVFGGGNVADFSGNAEVNVTGGAITDCVYGGGNQADVGGTTVNVTGGDVTNDVFGGGYGAGTNVTGNVTVTIGAVNDNNDHTAKPTVRDVYGGSALGNVNTNASNTTTVNILNGTINRNVYGGGLGNETTSAYVNGVVYVNVGDKVADPTTQNPYQKKLKGAASFVDSNIFGCNNVKGSPQNNVFVNIYQTAHTEKDTWNYPGTDATYAIDTLFGGGNHASYVPATAGCKITTTIDSCFNTINHVFGGGNAADLGVVSGTYTNVITDIRIHGGRFDYVFGGGNGYSPTGNHTHPELPYYNPGANIYGGIDLTITGGNIGQFFGGSNQAGDVFGTPNIAAASNDNCGDLNIENFFCGGNYTDVHTDVITKFECSEGMTVKNLYGGCNLANIEGCVELTIEGGTYRNVFGGSKGLAPTPTNPDGICPEITGHVKLVLKGGSMGDVFGGCDQNGQINGDIIIEVDDAKSTQCPLHIGNIYGGGNKTDYTPTDATATSPRVNIINGTVGGTFVVDNTNTAVEFVGNVFGGGNEGKVTSNPQVTIGDKDNVTTHEANILGNVYGGGNAADVKGNTNVILQGKATIGKFDAQGELKGGGSVYGGGKLADVDGKTNVTVESNE